MGKLYKKVGAVPALIGLMIAQGLVYAAPCYTRTGGTPGCLSLGGPVCSTILPVGLPCAGTWTIKQMSDLGLDPNAECSGNIGEYAIPEPNSTSGNEPSGFMTQGNFTFDCTSVQTCDKVVQALPPPILTYCNYNPLRPCTTYTVFTAGGEDCPPPPSGGE